MINFFSKKKFILILYFFEYVSPLLECAQIKRENKRIKIDYPNNS